MKYTVTTQYRSIDGTLHVHKELTGSLFTAYNTARDGIAKNTEVSISYHRGNYVFFWCKNSLVLVDLSPLDVVS